MHWQIRCLTFDFSLLKYFASLLQMKKSKINVLKILNYRGSNRNVDENFQFARVEVIFINAPFSIEMPHSSRRYKWKLCATSVSNGAFLHKISGTMARVCISKLVLSLVWKPYRRKIPSKIRKTAFFSPSENLQIRFSNCRMSTHSTPYRCFMWGSAKITCACGEGLTIFLQFREQFQFRAPPP